jgi:hypothetical protein
VTNVVWLSIFTLKWLIGLSSFELKNRPGAGEPLGGSDQPHNLKFFSWKKSRMGADTIVTPRPERRSRWSMAAVDGRADAA